MRARARFDIFARCIKLLREPAQFIKLNFLHECIARETRINCKSASIRRIAFRGAAQSQTVGIISRARERGLGHAKKDGRDGGGGGGEREAGGTAPALIGES